VGQFKRCDFYTCDAPRPGRTTTVTTPTIIDQIHELTLEDRRNSAKSIAEQLDISRERVGSIIHEDLNMRKLSAMWVPKCLNTDKTDNGAIGLSYFYNFFGTIQMISCRARLVTMDETWLYRYDPETKQQSLEWRHSGSPRPNKFRVQKFTGKFLASKVRDQNGILLYDYFPKGQSINAEFL
jgi:histone-lysine N-methyltransferase SETMAR